MPYLRSGVYTVVFATWVHPAATGLVEPPKSNASTAGTPAAAGILVKTGGAGEPDVDAGGGNGA